MTFWAISAFINAISSGTLGIFVFLKNKQNEINQSFVFFCLSLAVWSIAYYLWQVADTYQGALFWSRTLMVGAIFIPISYLHHIYSLIEKIEKYRKRIILSYVFGFISSFLVFTPFFIKSVSAKLSFKFWPDVGSLFLPFLCFWFLFVFLGVFEIVRSLLTAKGLLREQLQYVLVATLIGWIGGATNYPLWFGIPIKPWGNICASKCWNCRLCSHSLPAS